MLDTMFVTADITNSIFCALYTGVKFSLLFDPEDEVDEFLWNVGWLSLDYITLYSRVQTLHSQLWIQYFIHTRFEIFTAVKIHFMIFCIMTSCVLTGGSV